jgi:hypothetical protein
MIEGKKESTMKEMIKGKKRRRKITENNDRKK